MPQIGSMKRGMFFLILVLSSKAILAQNEVGPEGHKLLWFLLPLILFAGVLFIRLRRNKKTKSKPSRPFFVGRSVRIELEKDALYYPDRLKLRVQNKGNSDIDLDQPLLVFDNFWLKRKFKLKGFANRSFYPLFLESGRTHTLDIDLNRFYQHDKRLRRYPKAKVILHTVKGKRLGSQSVFIRKTLFKF